MTPRRIGPYEVLGLLGRGGAGAVYRARDPKLRREVALKLLGGAGTRSGSQVARFQREAEALARLRHPQIVRVHTVGEHDGVPYLVMDLVDGAPLSRRLEEDGPLPVEEALRIARLLSSALEHVHEQGLVHRDLKPDNVLIDRAGQPLLTDFGLVKTEDSTQALSREGALLGTPGYWPPEQARGQVDQIGPASDLYGLGATLFAMLTGEPPVRGETMVELLVATLERIPPPPSTLRAGVPPAVDAICARCLAKRPGDRYPDAASLSLALEDARGGRGRARPGLWRIAVLALLGVTLLGGLLAWRQRGAARPLEGGGDVVAPPRAGPSTDPWLACLRALADGEDRGSEAEALLAAAGRPAEEVWEQLAALPPGRDRARLLLLACLLAARDEQAVEVARGLDASWRQAVELARDLHALHDALDDVVLTTHGGEGNEALVVEVTRALARARRLRRDPLEPLAEAVARRWQAGLAHTLLRLRAVSGVSHDRLPASFFDRARALAPGSPECSYLDVVERWLIEGRELELSGRLRELDLRLAQVEVDARWDPVFVFMRGYVLLENGAEDVREAGELGWRVATEVPELVPRFARQWESLQGNLSVLLARAGIESLVRSEGAEGDAALSQAYRLAVSVLLGPGGTEVEVPSLAHVEAGWLGRLLERATRDATRGLSLALLGVGRSEVASEVSLYMTGEVGRPIGEVFRAEALLQSDQVVEARGVLEALRERAASYREFWGALAHARALTGDEAGAAEALASGLQAPLSLGLAWHAPEHLPALLAGQGWWPGLR